MRNITVRNTVRNITVRNTVRTLTTEYRKDIDY